MVFRSLSSSACCWWKELCCSLASRICSSSTFSSYCCFSWRYLRGGNEEMWGTEIVLSLRFLQIQMCNMTFSSHSSVIHIYRVRRNLVSTYFSAVPFRLVSWCSASRSWDSLLVNSSRMSFSSCRLARTDADWERAPRGEHNRWNEVHSSRGLWWNSCVWKGSQL